MIESEDKRFLEWIKVKERLHKAERLPHIKEGEIWWAGVGENVGKEINGKDEKFARPVLIYTKLSRYNFMAIPLTSKEHEGTWYVKFKFQGRDEVAVLSQARSMSVSRLYRKMGEADGSDMRKIAEGLSRLYGRKECP